MRNALVKQHLKYLPSVANQHINPLLEIVGGLRFL